MAVLHGDLFALAKPRGSGKITIAVSVCLCAILFGHREFVALFGASEFHAEEMLRSIKIELEGNNLLLEDFPEAIDPIQRFEGIANRCNGHLYQDERTHIKWTEKEIALPSIEGAMASGAIIKVAGITGESAARNSSGPMEEWCVRRSLFWMTRKQRNLPVRRRNVLSGKEFCHSPFWGSPGRDARFPASCPAQ